MAFETMLLRIAAEYGVRIATDDRPESQSP
jgi:hypothetical protein